MLDLTQPKKAVDFMRYLFFISQNYSFEILRPVQKLARERGDDVLWFLYMDRVNTELFSDDEKFTDDIYEAVNYEPDAVFVPGNVVPNFIPGLKVEVFHGFEWKKKGHFRIRGCFDLYCTQGPFFTERFQQLAQSYKYFDVVETGWTKLDPLFAAKPLPLNNDGKPIVLYAPTFSPSLTSAPDLVDEIRKLSESKDWHWVVKFHPKMAKEYIKQFEAIKGPNLEILEVGEISSLLQTADIIVSDTSSIITEFLLLNKPAVTYKNAQPEPVLIDITEPAQLEHAIAEGLTKAPQRLKLIAEYNEQIHPYQDGKSAHRLLDAVNKKIIDGKSAPKALPANLFRNLKMRKNLKFWQW